MRERMDFSSIIRIIRENMEIDSLNIDDFYYTLFFYAFEQEKYQISMPDTTEISRYLNGHRGITKAMLEVYKEDNNVYYLKKGVSGILKYVIDTAWIVEQLIRLVQNDKTIPFVKRKKLASLSDDMETFITECLLFGMSRKFIKRGTGGILQKNFVLSDYLLDNHVPSVGKVFVGRDAELDEINNKLNAKFCLFLEGMGELVNQNWQSNTQRNTSRIMKISFI